MNREDAARKYIVYVFGEVAPVSMTAQIDAVKDEFIRGWMAAADCEREWEEFLKRVTLPDRRTCF